MKVEVKIVAIAFIALSFYIDKSFSIIIPVRNPTCIYQTDLYDANSIYLKSVCYVNKQEYRDAGVESCDTIGMKIMDADDGSINVFAAIINKAMPNTPGGSAWVGGGSAGSCSIFSWVSLGNWQRVNTGCNNAYRGTVCEFNGLMPPVVSRPKPAACDIIKDIFDGQGKYLKTLCHVKYLQSHSNADNTCQAYSMALANSNEIASTLIAGAKLLYPNGARVWLSGNSASGCSAVQSPSAAAYYMTASAPCDSLHPSFCEYNKFVEPTLATTTTTTAEPTTTTTTEEPTTTTTTTTTEEPTTTTTTEEPTTTTTTEKPTTTTTTEEPTTTTTTEEPTTTTTTPTTTTPTTTTPTTTTPTTTTPTTTTPTTTTRPPHSPQRNGQCENQKDYYDSNGNYLKTICTYKQGKPRDDSFGACSSFGMSLAKTNDNPESLAILISRANEESPSTTDENLWIGGRQDGLCSVLRYQSYANFELRYVDCTITYYSYCEFNKNLPAIVVRPQPSYCDNIQDVYDNAGDYVKTLCSQNQLLQSQFNANKNCIYNGMELANSNEYVGNLKSFASRIHTSGGWIWLRQKNDLDCTVLTAPIGTNVYVLVNTHPCYAKYVSFCEYNKFVPFVNNQPATTLSTHSPQRNPQCQNQQDHYDANGNYFKTYCTLKQVKSSDASAAACNSFGMSLAKTNDNRESLAIVTYRANEEYSSQTDGNLWIGGRQDGLCSVLRYQSYFNFELRYVDCNLPYYSYCEFNKNL